ncbi:hypothetical protein SDC9_163106 [bioreactor metagenome]|uniref:Uncharacterized protein n=1 Tax=bioreactor metagenome TaxID=1076179 RepID=A0A645FP92_9ZZZZ
MVHRHHSVEVPPKSLDEQNIGGKRTGGFDSARFRLFDGRLDHVDFLASAQTVFTSVGIQSRQTQAGLGYAGIAQ